jgi:hypothetical protein
VPGLPSAVACWSAGGPWYTAPIVTHVTLLWLGLLLVFVADAPLHAYIDPGSTSLFLQGLIGGVAALVVATRSWWQRGLARLRGRKLDGTSAE